MACFLQLNTHDMKKNAHIQKCPDHAFNSPALHFPGHINLQSPSSTHFPGLILIMLISNSLPRAVIHFLPHTKNWQYLLAFLSQVERFGNCRTPVPQGIKMMSTISAEYV